MGKRLPFTPNSQIRSALRNLTMRCRERQAARKSSGYCCVECGAHHSRAAGRHVTVEAHHKHQPNWDKIFWVIRTELLPSPEHWEPLCDKCHKLKHEVGE